MSNEWSDQNTFFNNRLFPLIFSFHLTYATDGDLVSPWNQSVYVPYSRPSLYFNLTSLRDRTGMDNERCLGLNYDATYGRHLHLPSDIWLCCLYGIQSSLCGSSALSGSHIIWTLHWTQCMLRAPEAADPQSQHSPRMLNRGSKLFSNVLIHFWAYLLYILLYIMRPSKYIEWHLPHVNAIILGEFSLTK